MAARRPTQTRLSLDAGAGSVGVTVGELIERYLVTAPLAPKSLAVRRTQMRAIGRVDFEGRSVLELDTSELDPVVVQTVYDVAAKGQKGKPAPLMGVRCVELLRLAWKWGSKASRRLVPANVNPCAEVEAPRPRAEVPEIRAEVVGALWAATFVLPFHPALLFIRFLILSGLRPWSEALPMTCAQLFQTPGGRWAIRLVDHKTKRHSGPKVRTLGAKAAALLVAQREAVGGRGLLWPSIVGGPGITGEGTFHPDTVKRAFKAVREEAAKHVDLDPRIYTYCLRHGFATSALEAGSTLTAVQAALGHDNVQSTLHYLRTVPGREGETADAVAGLVIEGAGASLEDLAKEIGCEASVTAMLAAVRAAREALGLTELVEITAMRTTQNTDQSTPSTPSKWDQQRFLAACLRAGIVRPIDLTKKLTEHRKKHGNTTPVDPRTADRWHRGERRPDLENACELADLLGVSIDYLTGRDEFVAAKAAAC